MLGMTENLVIHCTSFYSASPRAWPGADPNNLGTQPQYAGTEQGGVSRGITRCFQSGEKH